MFWAPPWLTWLVSRTHPWSHPCEFECVLWPSWITCLLSIRAMRGREQKFKELFPKEGGKKSCNQQMSSTAITQKSLCSFFFFNFYFYFILLYNTVLVLPYIDMNQPRVYMTSQSWTLLPSPTPYHLSESSPCTSPSHPVSCIEHRLVIHFLHDSIHVSVPFSHILPPSPSPTESKSPFYTSVSLLLSRIQVHHYHLSKFRIYVSVYCIGVFLSGLLHSV